MNSIDQIISKIGTYIVNPLLLVIFATGFFLFMWGLFEFMVNMDSAADRETGKQHMIWGTVGMLIMVSVYGIMSLLINTLGITSPSSTSGTVDVNVSTFTL